MPFCPYCGNSVPQGASFCSSCGRSLLPAASPAPQMPSSGAAPPAGGASELTSASEIVMKKKILSLREHYDFEDRGGRKLGEGDGNFFQFPARFAVLDAAGSEVMRVEGKVLTIRHEFHLYDNTGAMLGAVKKKIVKLIGQEWWVEQNGTELMRIYGNFTEHDYRMEINKQVVAQVHKKWVSIRDQFGISIVGPVDPRLVLGAVIVVEHVEVTEREKQHNSPGIGFG
jgi:uncharacterized protein YxjI